MLAPMADAQGEACPTSRHDSEGHGNITDQSTYRNGLRCLEVQIGGKDWMINEERYCVDILTQISAITRALDSVALGLLDAHGCHCVLDAATTGQLVSDLTIAGASDAIARLVRS